MFQLTGIDDFTFLTRDSFLLVRPCGRFEVYGFTDPKEHRSTPVLRVSYAFPPLSHGYIYWYISMSSNPAPGYVPLSSSSSTVFRGGRYIHYPSPEDRIHACCLYIFNPTVEDNPVVHSFVFFVNLKTLANPPAAWLRPRQSARRAKSRSSSQTSLLINLGDDSTSTSSSTDDDISYHNTSIRSGSNSPGQSNPAYPPFPTFDYVPQPHPLASNDHQYLPMHMPPPLTFSTTLMPTPTFPTQVSNSLSNSASASSRGEHGMIIPWEVWGPQSTRWFEECLSTDWQHAVYGSRTIESMRPENHPEILRSSSYLEILRSSSYLETPTSNGMASASTHTNVETAHEPPSQTVESGTEIDDEDDDTDGQDGRSRSPQRFLRMRNFNPYVFKDADFLKHDPSLAESEDLYLESEEMSQSSRGRSRTSDGKRLSTGKAAKWSKPRLITGPSTTHAKGIFTHDIISWLPYTEVISKETYDVTDVMMDDSRLLLLKVRLIVFLSDYEQICLIFQRGRAGRLKRVEVLMA